MWESCITIGRQWAWKPNDDMKSLKQCLQTLITCAAGDGNLLFNVGPTPDGVIEARQIERLREMGYSVQLNHPFKGAELVERFGRPWQGRHSLQIEVNRGLYMDEDRIEKHDGFEALKGSIERLMDDICAFAHAQVRR